MNRANHRSARNRSIRHALLTSIIARIAGVLLQVVSLPIAAAALGAEGFSLYAMLSAMLSWMMLSNLGIGQATTLHASRSFASGEPERALQLFLAAVISVSFVSVAVGLIVVALVNSGSAMEAVFGNHAEGMDSVRRTMYFLCIAFVCIQISSVFEAMQLARQKQHVFNIFMCVGTGISAIAVYIAAQRAPDILSILAAVHTPTLASRIINAALFSLGRLPRIADLVSVRRPDCVLILRDGVRFLSGTSLNHFLCHPLAILIVGMFSSSATSASFAAVMNAVILAAAFFSVVMTPFRGALPEAERRGDHDWIRKMYVLSLLSNMSYSAIPFVLFAIIGDRLFEFWYGGTVAPGDQMLIAAGFYMFCLAAEVTNYNFLASLGQVRSASRWLVWKGLASAGLLTGAAAIGHAEWCLWSLVVANVCLSLGPLGFMSFKVVQSGPGAGDA